MMYDSVNVTLYDQSSDKSERVNFGRQEFAEYDFSKYTDMFVQIIHLQPSDHSTVEL